MAITFYRECEKIKCPPYLKDQLARAASSIALNLSEGSTRPTPKDRRRFYMIALGSLRECQTLLDLVNHPDKSLHELADKLGANIFRLAQAVHSTKSSIPENWPG